MDYIKYTLVCNMLVLRRPAFDPVNGRLLLFSIRSLTAAGENALGHRKSNGKSKVLNRMSRTENGQILSGGLMNMANAAAFCGSVKILIDGSVRIP